MAELDDKDSRLTLKLVFYGPALSGKTTNLMRLHDLLQPELKGDVMVLDTRNDRTIFFDMLPLGVRAPSGLLVKLKLYTVPGQVVHDSTRKAVLSRADGVVFVADSQRSQQVNNAESFQNLEENAARVGLDFGKLPIVVQYNKRDLPAIVPEQELRERWSKAPWPLQFASALTGSGVLETFEALLRAVYREASPAYGLATDHGLEEEAFVNAALGRQSTANDDEHRNRRAV
jgi:signal recognition particle receptor subunit beta